MKGKRYFDDNFIQPHTTHTTHQSNNYTNAHLKLGQLIPGITHLCSSQKLIIDCIFPFSCSQKLL